MTSQCLKAEVTTATADWLSGCGHVTFIRVLRMWNFMWCKLPLEYIIYFDCCPFQSIWWGLSSVKIHFGCNQLCFLMCNNQICHCHHLSKMCAVLHVWELIYTCGNLPLKIYKMCCHIFVAFIFPKHFLCMKIHSKVTAAYIPEYEIIINYKYKCSFYE